MQRYFSIDDKLTLSKDDIHHIINVMRMKENDQIEIVNNGKVYLCNIDSIDNKNVFFSVVDELKINNELDKKITIAFALVNENKTDFILQKATELGAYSFVPLKMKNSKVKIESKESKKIERWNKITKEAAEQSFRNISPNVSNIMTLKELVNLDYDLKLIASTKEKEKNIKNMLQNAKECDNIIIVVGPEGGIDKSEEDFLIENGFKATTLGDSILRVETAPIFVMSAVRYELMR